MPVFDFMQNFIDATWVACQLARNPGPFLTWTALFFLAGMLAHRWWARRRRDGRLEDMQGQVKWMRERVKEADRRYQDTLMQYVSLRDRSQEDVRRMAEETAVGIVKQAFAQLGDAMTQAGERQVEGYVRGYLDGHDTISEDEVRDIFDNA